MRMCWVSFSKGSHFRYILSLTFLILTCIRWGGKHSTFGMFCFYYACVDYSMINTLPITEILSEDQNLELKFFAKAKIMYICQSDGFFFSPREMTGYRYCGSWITQTMKWKLAVFFTRVLAPPPTIEIWASSWVVLLEWGSPSLCLVEKEE